MAREEEFRIHILSAVQRKDQEDSGESLLHVETGEYAEHLPVYRYASEESRHNQSKDASKNAWNLILWA